MARAEGLPLAMLIAAAASSLAVASGVREGVFYSGDGGVKFALASQFAKGDLHLDLRLPAEPWVAGLWDSGLYPLDAPFSYVIDGRRYVKDPVFFPILTAPLYAALGWPGLYVVPLLGLWATWAAFLWLGRRLATGPIATALGLGALAFASPLTLYGAMYWEHTLAVALAFWGMALLAAPEAAAPRAGRALLGGALVALSAWFRSEHLWLVAVLASLALASRPLGLGLRRVPLVLVGLLAPVAALLAFNAGVYGHPLGVHGLQVAEPVPWSIRTSNAIATQGALLSLLAGWFPLALPALAAAVPAMVRPHRPDGAPARFLAWSAVLYVVLLPAILPRPETGGEGGRQWGPRFLLVVLPMLCAAATQSAGAVAALRSRAWGALVVAAFAITAAAGAWQNTWRGARELRRDYAERMLPLLELLRRDPAVAVAASEQFASQELMALAGEKRFFFVRRPEDLEQLGAAVLGNGSERYLFLSDQVVRGASPFSLGGGSYFLRVQPLGRFGWRLVAHEVRVAAFTLPAQPAPR